MHYVCKLSVMFPSFYNIKLHKNILVVHQENEKRIKKNNEKQKSVLSGKLNWFTQNGCKFLFLFILVSATALPTLFRLAETVEQKSFSNLDEAKKLKVESRPKSFSFTFFLSNFSVFRIESRDVFNLVPVDRRLQLQLKIERIV